MFGDSVYLQALPKFGETELFLTRAERCYYVKARRNEYLGDRVFVVEPSRLGPARVRYSTRLHAEFTIVEEGAQQLIDGTQTELANLFFCGRRDPLRMRVRPPTASSIEFRKLPQLFCEQQGLHEPTPGRIALKKRLRGVQERLDTALGHRIELTLEPVEDVLLWRGLQSLEAAADLAAEDADYREALGELAEFRLAEAASTSVFAAVRTGPTLSILHSRGLYRSYEATKAWLHDNL